MEVEYNDCSVAFLDVLGWREATKRSVEDNALLARMVEAVATSYTPDLIGGSFHPPPNYPQVSQFSDSIVISVSGSGPSERDSFFDKVTDFCILMLQNGFFVRGGISDGQMFHRGNIAIGPALVEAIDLEKKATWPQVILPRGSWTPPQCPVRPSGRGMVHLDILRAGLARMLDLGNVRTIVEAKLAEHPPGRAPEVRNKYIWVARYFNEVAEQNKLELITHDLTWEPRPPFACKEPACPSRVGVAPPPTN